MTQDILISPIFQWTKTQIHHGAANTLYDHSVATAKLAYRIGKKCNIAASELKELTRAALLHDFFGYNWHEGWYQTYKQNYHGIEKLKHMHAMIHGEIAADRANIYFGISPHQWDVISSHMFPLANHLPHGRDAWILVLADKLVATEDLGKTVEQGIDKEVRLLVYPNMAAKDAG